MSGCIYIYIYICIYTNRDVGLYICIPTEISGCIYQQRCPAVYIYNRDDEIPSCLSVGTGHYWWSVSVVVVVTGLLGGREGEGSGERGRG